MNTPVFGVVLVEDDEVDVESVDRGFRTLKSAHSLTVYRSATEALLALRGPQVQQPPSPYVLLLDLNLPGMSGLEFLAEIRKDPQLSRTVVFVMTGSSDPADAVAADSLRVAGYLHKSELGRNYHALVSLIDVYMKSVTLADSGLG